MRYLKMYENFKEKETIIDLLLSKNNDNIGLGILLYENNPEFKSVEIDNIIKVINYLKVGFRNRIGNVVINRDGVVDVSGDAILSYLSLNSIPVKFGKVTGSFNCAELGLTNLVNAPKEVGNFYCHVNELTSLVGSPSIVHGHFNCQQNNLVTLEGGPNKIGGGFYCGKNPLTSLKGCPKEVVGTFNCSFCKITTLKYCPEKVGLFDCVGNPVHEVYKMFPNHKSFVDSLDYDYFRDDAKISKFRLESALLELNLECPKEINGYEFI